MLVGISVDIYAMVGEAAISLCRLGKGRLGKSLSDKRRSGKRRSAVFLLIWNWSLQSFVRFVVKSYQMGAHLCSEWSMCVLPRNWYELQGMSAYRACVNCNNVNGRDGLSLYLCNGLNVLKWTGPLACLSLFSVMSWIRTFYCYILKPCLT